MVSKPKLTEYNVHQVLFASPDQLLSTFPHILEQLSEPNIDKMTLYQYVHTITEVLQGTAEESPNGFDYFATAAFKSGIVQTMLKIGKDPRTDQWHALSSYFAMEVISDLMSNGNAKQRKALMVQLVENDAVSICIDKLQNHPLVIHRQIAAALLRCFSAESFLGKLLTSKETSDLMVILCEHILKGPDMYEKQLGDPSLSWQSFLCFGSFGASTQRASRYAPRYYALSQENAAWGVTGLVARCPPPDANFCHEILKHNPRLLDLMLQCASMGRPAWYPDSVVNSVICEGLVMLFRVPETMILGINVGAQWEAVQNSLKLLISRPKWSRLLLGVWDSIAEEKWEDLKEMAKEGERRYNAISTMTEADFLSLFETNGSCRICIERLITTISHVTSRGNTDDAISDYDLYALLRLCNTASRDVNTDIEQLSTNPQLQAYCESAFELCRKPLWAAFTDDAVDDPLQVPPETVMGPTSFARVLTLLARRGLLDNIHRLAKLPEGGGAGSRTSLSKVKEITRQDNIRRFLILARKRVTARREQGHSRFKTKELDYACLAYTTAAELAAALIAFDEATTGVTTDGSDSKEGKYSQQLLGVRKELVLCLGNAAEMCLGLQRYERALPLALSAVDSVAGLPMANALDAVDDSIRAKNLRRVERAKAGQQLTKA